MASDLLLKNEPLWVIPSLAFACTTLVWGLGWSWIGLVVASIPLALRRWTLGYFSRGTLFEIAVTLLLVASAVGVVVSPDRGLSLRAFQSVLACILLYYSLVNIPHAGYIKWAFAFAAAGILMAALLAFREGLAPPPALEGFGNWVQQQVQHLPRMFRPSRIANPTFSAAHGLTIALEMVLLPLAGVMLFSRKASGRMAAAAMVLPFLLCLALFGSQAAWLSVSVGGAILLVWRSRWVALPLAAAAVVGYLGYRLGWLDPGSLFSDFHPGEGLSARVELWKGALDVIGRHPITGCGLGCLGRHSTTTLLSPHSAYLQFYADFGILGALALLGALVVGARMAIDLVKAGPCHFSRY